MEVKDLNCLSPNKIVYCTMEVDGGDKLQTDQAEASKPWSTAITTTTTTTTTSGFRLDALLSVIATATWLGGWLAGWLGVRHTPVLYQNG